MSVPLPFITSYECQTLDLGSSSYSVAKSTADPIACEEPQKYLTLVMMRNNFISSDRINSCKIN